MPKLTGYQRCVLVALWLKSDREIPREEYIKRVCKAKGLDYVPPQKLAKREP